MSEAVLTAESNGDWQLLHDEIDRLAERLRAPVTLCYLEGLSYDAAANQLALSATTLRGRLARARETFRHRLSRRGVTAPAGRYVVSSKREVMEGL